MKFHEASKLHLVIILLGALALTAIAGCASLPTDQSKPQPQVAAPTPAPELTVEQPEPEQAKPQSQVTSTIAVKDLTDLAAKSSCASYYWKDRGRAPKGYFKGMVLVYARAVCHPERADVAIVANPKATDVVHDALAHYNLAGGDALQKSYALLIGLGLRESSGKFCCGRDMSAGFSSADSAEAGTFQTSWGARRVSPELTKMFAKYNANKTGCLLDVFKEGASCSAGDAKNWGTGDGLQWQALTKTCPAFGAEYAAVLVRLLGGTKGEFGPLRNKAAEYRPECVSLLEQVKELVQKNPGICSSL